MNAFKLSAFAAVGLALVYACGGDNLTLPSEGQPAHIEIVGEGNGQTGVVSSPLDKPLIFLVTDTQGRPVAGATVNFVLEEDGGGGLVTPASDTTDGSGQVSTSITLGTQVGQLTGQAQVQVPEATTPVAVGFTAFAVSSDARILSMVSGDQQSAAVGAELALPLVVKVTDGFENPIAGVTVHWSAEGGGEVSEESTVTGDDGQTSVTRTLGSTAGEQQTVATAEGVEGPPVTFTHTATAGTPSAVNIVSGNKQEAPAGTKLPQPLVVQLLDEDRNPIPNKALTWVVGTGGGSVNPSTSTTGPDGKASTEWTLGPTPGDNTLNAVVSGLSPAQFTATGTGTGAPSNLAVTTQPPSSVALGATLSPGPVVQVRDGAGHDLAVPGVDITVSISSGSGQLEGTRTVATDANGRAQFSDLRITKGSGPQRLIFAADGFRSATSNKIDVEKASTTTGITSDDPDPSDPGQPVTVTFSVSSPSGTPSGEVEVSASDSEKCTAQVAQGSCQLVLTSPGDRTLTATYKGSDVFASSSTTESHVVNAPANQPPVAGPDAYSTPFGTVLEVPAPGVLGNDHDPEGAALTAQLADPPTQGLVTLAGDGSFSYFPGGLSGTSDTFTYDVSDGVLTTRQTVTITVQ